MGELTNNYNRLLKMNCDYSETPGIPNEMSLEIFTACNHKCLFCPNRKQTKISKMMKVDEARRLLNEASELGIKRVGLYAKGEPFMVKNIDEYILQAKLAGFKEIFLTTNGSLITKDTFEKCLSAGLTSIKFSINGFGKDNYAVIHGKDDWNRVVNALEIAIAIKKSQGLKVFVSVVRTNIDPEAYEKINNKWGNQVDEIISYECTNFCGYLDNREIAFTQNIKESRCNLPFNKIHITPDSLLVACCGDYQDYLAIADLKEMSIHSAWLCDDFKKLRQMHINNKLDGLICKTCLFGGKNQHKPINDSFAKHVDSDYWGKSDTLELLIKRKTEEK